ncbi:MAG TPA: hypothetical protein EYO79_00900 [Candidatus Marinimicrobia bacterium]|nr:hypothetical protein [Candidatus Neomarinimicrobiota bacterium]
MRFIFKYSLLFIASVLSGTGTQFLATPSNGFELALGSNAIQKYSINPATHFINGPTPTMGISYGSWLDDSKISAIKVSFPGQKISYGFDLKYVNLDDLELRSERPTDNPLATYGTSGFSLGGSFSKEWLGMDIGAVLRYVRIDLYTENSSGLAVDIGITRNISSRINIGTAILNIGKMTALRNEEPKLPLRFITTANYKYEIDQLENDIAITSEWSNLINGSVFYMSTVSKWKSLSFCLSSKLAESVTEISGGLGLQFGMYRINYGVRFGSQNLGMPQMIDLTIQLP